MGSTHDYRYYTPDEETFVRETALDPIDIVAEILGRTRGSIAGTRLRLLDPVAYAEMRTYQNSRNDDSREGADNNRASWARDEDQFVLDTVDDPLSDVADCLGRTIHAVAGRRHLLRSDVVVAYRDAFQWRRSVPLGGQATLSKDQRSCGPLCSSCFTYHNGGCY